MLKSMTGYGKAVADFAGKQITVELRSVNSKQLDLNTRMPGLYREKELELRNEIAKAVERGKVDFSINVDNSAEDKNVTLNAELVKAYYNEVKTIADIANQPQTDFVAILSRMPDVWNNTRPTLEDPEWKALLEATHKALAQFNDFRTAEGNTLADDLKKRIGNIQHLLKSITPFEVERTTNIKTRLTSKIKEVQEYIDQNRLEQELIFYIEKLDITEEKVRLTAHLDYFNETMALPENSGRKLGFISQEIGREINTIGSKANDAAMQRIVVQMKDELEKIKEQLLNVL